MLIVANNGHISKYDQWINYPARKFKMYVGRAGERGVQPHLRRAQALGGPGRAPCSKKKKKKKLKGK